MSLRIHSAVLDALEVVGLSQAPKAGVEIMTGGAILGDDGRLRFPRALVEDMVDKAANPSRCLAATRVRPRPVGNTGAFRHRRGRRACGRCREERSYRPPPRRISTTRRGSPTRSTMSISSSAPWSAARSSTISRWTSTRSMPAWRHHEACRHVLLGPVAVEPGMDLIHMVAGGEAAWRARPFVSNCPTVSSCRR
jgi:trimethylamine--corrinoid protein Co-methyltransferase